MRLRTDEKGLSPVVGTILMVAITVLLAAAAATIVFGIFVDVEKKTMPSIVANRVNETYIALVLVDAGGASEIRNCTLNGGEELPETFDDEGWEVGERIYVEGVRGDVTVACVVDGVKRVVLYTSI